MEEDLLNEWWRRTFVNLVAHNRAEVRLRRMDRTLGASAVAFVIAVGGVALGFGVDTLAAKLAVAIGTLCASLLSFFQAYLGYGEAASQHRVAARHHAAIHRLVERTLAIPPDDAAGVRQRVDEVERWWNLTASGAPNVSERDRAIAEQQVLDRILLGGQGAIPGFVPGQRLDDV